MLEKIIELTNLYIDNMPKKERKKYGQFFTSMETAKFMANLYDAPLNKQSVMVLDAGAGSGILSCAFIEWAEQFETVKEIELTCYENDDNVLGLLKANLEYCKIHSSKIIRYNIQKENYITSQYLDFNYMIGGNPNPIKYDYVIGNPPYMKIPKDAPEATAMPEVCYGAPNMYFIFAAMGLFNLKDEGEMVYIIPRSWTSGAYFKRFRQYFLTEGKLELYGNLDSGSPQPGVRYAAIARVVCKGKQTKQSTDEKSIVVRNADEAWIVVSAKTSYLSGEIYETEADRLLNEALRSNFSEILPEAVRSYQALYNRARICLPENEAVSHLTTDERIEKFQKQDDPSLAALYYNYGRYLLISSTRPGSLPPNLQGLWANATRAPWNGDYHTNINVQMNHWLVEQANLSELYTPLIDLVKRLVDSGKESAKAFYGPQAKGWVLHMMTNVWNYTVP